MITKTPPAFAFLIFLTTILFFTGVATGQGVPTLPCCIDFNDPDQGGISGQFVEDLEIRYPGPSGDPADGYLHAKDDSGGSWAFLSDPADGTPSCFGNWKELLGPGRCLELCWDVNLLTDGDNSQVIAKPARITIWSGSLRATFRTFVNITEGGGPNNGWYTFCAPIALPDSDGNLPSNVDGEWIMNDANGDPAPAADFTKLLCNVDKIGFFVDYHSSQTEEWCWDNVCLQEGECPDCMEVSTGKWDCVVNADGTRTLKYTFDVTNNSAHSADVALIPDADGFDIEPNVYDFVPDLGVGETTTVTLCFDDVQAGHEICFDFVLFHPEVGECCRKEICLKIPCVKISEEAISCDSVAGSTLYQFTLTNISGGPVETAYLLSKDPGVTVAPGMVPLGGLADGASVVMPPLTITGATPNEEYCFCIVLLDESRQRCCIQEVCLRIPDCGQGPAGDPNQNGRQVKPCEKDDPTVSVYDGCFCICNSSILCDPANPGSVIWTFTIENKSSSVMDHLLIPWPDASPGFVSFPDPLDPGEAAQVTLTLNNQTPGPVTVPLTLVSTEDCVCCSADHPLEIPDCDCIQVLEDHLECAGIDPVTGLLCYTYTATIQNLTGETLEHLFFIPPNGNPQGISFDPANLPLGSLADGATTTVTTTIKVPPGTNGILFTISVHNGNFEECCAIERRLPVPDCCDCVGEAIFEFDPANPQDTLPEGVSLINLEQNPNTGKVGFSPDGKITPFPYVYMAASARGTVVRIDADTGVILGEYRTAPETNGGPNPSRTTVDKFGECWLGNRNPRVPGSPGSVVRIGLVVGGTRGDRTGPLGGPYTFTPNPGGEYLQGPFSYLSPSVLDRDGDGLIRTSTGLGNILDWDAALTGGNDPGDVSLAEDECIVNYVIVPESGPRALAIDSNNDLWVGGLSTSIYQQVFGATGTLGVTHNVPGGYGAVIDGNDVLWSVQSGTGVHRHDLVANTTTFTPKPAAYGIGIDPCDGNIWVSSYSNLSPILTEINPAGTVVSTNPQQGAAQGLCVDQNGDVWISGIFYNGAGVWRHDSSGVYQNTISAPVVGSTGVAVDHNGKIWVSDRNGDAAHRIDPGAGPAVDLTAPMGVGAAPYNYSDMTGFVTLGASGQTGVVLFTHDSLCPGTEWGRVSWQATGLSADGCELVTEVRASDDPLNYPATWTEVGNNISFCGGVGLPSITGQYIQVRVILTRPSGCPPECDPQLCWLKVECCDRFEVGPGNPAPHVEIGGPVFIPNGGAPAPAEVTAHVFDPAGGDLEAIWLVNGRATAAIRVAGDDIISLAQEFPDGISEVVLTVSDGQNVVSARTTVMVGDHEAPVVDCNRGEFATGDLRVSSFTATIPELLRSTVATDNVTAASAIILRQEPPAGQVVGQGVHPITVSATDEAGNTGKCTVYLIVEPAVEIASVPKYSRFPTGAPISLNLSYAVPASEIAETIIFLNGEVFEVIKGPLTTPLQLELADGTYDLSVAITSFGGERSRSRLIPFLVTSDPAPGPKQASPLVIRWETPAKKALLLKFKAPENQQCCVQLNTGFDPDEWSTVHVLDGKGQEATYRYPIDTDATPTLFFRIRYLP